MLLLCLAEIVLAHKVHQIKTRVGFCLLVFAPQILLLGFYSRRVQLFKDRAVKIVLFIPVIFVVFLAVRSLELIAVHSASDFIRHLAHLGGVLTVDHDSQGLDKLLFRIVEVWQLNREIELVD